MASSPFWAALQSIGAPPGSIVFDLGAHIGSFSLLAAGRAQGRVLAFEPDIQSVQLCRANAALNGLEGLIRCEPLAVGGETTIAQLYATTENWGHTLVASGGPFNVLTGEQTSVQCLSLEDALDFAPGQECAFLKFNIEGAEFDMFQNAPFETLRRIGAMAGEVHFDLGRSTAEPLIACLRNAGFAPELEPAGANRAILVARRA